MNVIKNKLIDEFIKEIYDYFSGFYDVSFFKIDNIYTCDLVDSSSDGKLIYEVLTPEDMQIYIKLNAEELEDDIYRYITSITLLHELTHAYDKKLFFDKYNCMKRRDLVFYDLWCEFHAYYLGEFMAINKNKEIFVGIEEEFVHNFEHTCEPILDEINQSKNFADHLAGIMKLLGYCAVRDKLEKNDMEDSFVYDYIKKSFDKKYVDIVFESYQIMYNHISHDAVIFNDINKINHIVQSCCQIYIDD